MGGCLLSNSHPLEVWEAELRQQKEELKDGYIVATEIIRA